MWTTPPSMTPPKYSGGAIEDVKLIVTPDRTGTSATKDLAARSSRGDVLVFLDAHCKPEPGAIERLVQDVERWNETAIVSPRILGLDPLRWENHASPGCNGFWVDLEWFHTGWTATEAMSRVVDESGRSFLEQPSLVGCCLAVSRTLYETLWGFDRDMRSWGVEDLDLGLKCWLLGSRLLIDPEAVIGHRFRKENGTYPVPAEHVYANRLRMARKNFGEPVWTDWLEQSRRAATEELWEKTWNCFEETRESAERERDYLMQRRQRDEFQYASEFGLVWPLILPSSPLPRLCSRLGPDSVHLTPSSRRFIPSPPNRRGQAKFPNSRRNQSRNRNRRPSPNPSRPRNQMPTTATAKRSTMPNRCAGQHGQAAHRHSRAYLRA